MQPTEQDSLHIKNPIVLWVEDILTRDYLSTLWEDESAFFSFRIAGSRESVVAVVKDQRELDNHVFGIVDRDFYSTNFQNWNNPNSSLIVFVPPVHEIENYALDWNAVNGCDLNQQGRSLTQIENRARAFAQAMQWWMACRKVISKFREEVFGKYITHPKPTEINSLIEAETFIQTTDWWNRFPNASAQILNTSLQTELNLAYGIASHDFNTNDWVQLYSGKEIFREVRGYVYDNPPVNSSKSQRDSDFAKAIANWQRDNNHIPPDLETLRNALKARVGL